MPCLEYILNQPLPISASGSSAAVFTPREAQTARAFHRSFREYAPTPLLELPALAAFLGLGRIWVKDESRRFGLKAFKALGSAYAVGRLLGRRLGLSPTDLSRARAGLDRAAVGAAGRSLHARGFGPGPGRCCAGRGRALRDHGVGL